MLTAVGAEGIILVDLVDRTVGYILNVETTMSNHSPILAFIAARGGSVGIVRKNMRQVGGISLVGRCIQSAQAAKCVDRVVVSTDDDEIAEESQRYGAQVVRRPPELSGGDIQPEPALLLTLDHLRDNDGFDPKIIVMMQCTSPMTLPEDVDGAVQNVIDKQADCGFTAKVSDAYLWSEDEDGYAQPMNHDGKVRITRQQRRMSYEENGAVYVMRTEGFVQAKFRFFGRRVMHLMPASRSIEIDTVDDLQLAEVLINQRRQAT